MTRSDHTPSSPVSAPSPAGGVREALEAFNNLIRYGARANSDQSLRAADGTLFRFDDREAFFLSDMDRDAIRAALSSPATPEPANGEVETLGECCDGYEAQIAVLQQVIKDRDETIAALSNPAPGHGEAEPVALPDEMTPAIADALSIMLWTSGTLARAYREVGFDIPRKAEAEQAFVLFRCLRFAIQHGDDWRTAAQDELTKLRAEKPAKQEDNDV